MPCAIWGYLEESQQKVILNIKFSLSRKWGAKCWEKDPSEDLRYYYCAKFHSSRSQTRRALIQVWMKYIQVAMLSRDFTAWNISLLLDAVVSSVHFCAYYAHSSQSKTKQCALNQVWKKLGSVLSRDYFCMKLDPFPFCWARLPKRGGCKSPFWVQNEHHHHSSDQRGSVYQGVSSFELWSFCFEIMGLFGSFETREPTICFWWLPYSGLLHNWAIKKIENIVNVTVIITILIMIIMNIIHPRK